MAHLLHVLLLATSEVEHVIGVFDEHGALCLCLCDVDRVREHSDLSLRDLLHIAFHRYKTSEGTDQAEITHLLVPGQTPYPEQPYYPPDFRP